MLDVDDTYFRREWLVMIKLVGIVDAFVVTLLEDVLQMSAIGATATKFD